MSTKDPENQKSPEEIKQLFINAIKCVDWHNLTAAFYQFSQGYQWGKYRNDTWVPDWVKLKEDLVWLEQNAEDLFKIIRVMYLTRPKPVRKSSKD